MPLVFELKSEPHLPVDVRALNPDLLSGLAKAQIEKIGIELGNKKARVADWFHVSGEIADNKVLFKGKLGHVHSIGRGLGCGSIEVIGSAGRHLGDSMTGGQIVVNGNVDDYAGYEMCGGTLVVHGKAGNHLGGCFPGAKYGMNRGTILVAGSAGNGLGYRMRRGTIVVGRNVGKHCGWQMRAGTIIGFGASDGPVGVNMRRGTIYLGEQTGEPDTFLPVQSFQSPILDMLGKWLSGVSNKFQMNFPKLNTSQCSCHSGDFLNGNKGELVAGINLTE